MDILMIFSHQTHPWPLSSRKEEEAFDLSDGGVSRYLT